MEFLDNGGTFPSPRSEQEYWRLQRTGLFIQAQTLLDHILQLSQEQRRVIAGEARQPDPQVQEQLLPSQDEMIQNDEQVARNLQTQFNRASMYTTVNYVNNTNQTAYVYWLKGPQELLRHCCDVTKESVVINLSFPSSSYALNTRIVVLKTKLNRAMMYNLRNIPKKDIIMETNNTIQNQTIVIEADINQWKEAALKMDYMFKQMIKLGADNEKVYSNIAPIVDMHQDIYIPEHTEQDKESSGIPSVLTNV